MEIVGRITANAEVKELKDNRKVVQFSIAMNDRYRSKEGVKKVTTYVNCSYWLSHGIAEYLTKSTLVQLSGRISASAWKNHEGEPVAGLNFHVDGVKFLGGSARVSNEQQNSSATVPDAAQGDDLPF